MVLYISLAIPSQVEETVARAGMRTESVDPQTVDGFTRMAQAVWAGVFGLLAINERSPEMAGDVTPELIAEAAKLGKWSVRREKGIKCLVEFYRSWLGDEAATVITEYWAAKDNSFFADHDDPRYARWLNAQRALWALHDGVIVDDYSLLRLTDEPSLLG